MTTKRTTRIVIYATPEEADEWRTEAEGLGLELGTWVRLKLRGSLADQPKKPVRRERSK